MKKRSIDFYYLLTVLALLAIGLLMVMSASSESARNANYTGGDAYYFIKRQGLWAVLSLIALTFLANFNFKGLAKFADVSIIGSIILLFLVLVIGKETNGGQRWINLGFFQLQPSEVTKVAVILFFSYHLSKKHHALNSFKKDLLPYLFILGIIAILLMLQPHFSATVLIIMVGVIILFVAGAKIQHLLSIGLPAVALGCVAIFTSQYRLERVTTFMHPFKDKLDSGWQITQSLYAIGSGGIFGLGLGKSREKFSYMSEPHNDFIFSILCEELGFIGALLVIALFGILIWRGIQIAIHCPDKFGSYMAIGITSLIAIQVCLNLAVITSSMPVTGIPLPFFSYGGTSLVINMACMGIMLNISKFVDSGGAKK